MTYLNDNIQILTWQNAKYLLEPVNNTLAKLIDEFNPDASYKFIKVRYQFGQSIVKNGRLHLPISKNKTISIDETDLNASLKNQLNYNILPIWLNINRKSEVFYENYQRVMPTKVISPGVLLGLWEAFDPKPDTYTESLWNVIAGVRSLFMLPKITDQIANKRIRQALNINTSVPTHILDQFLVFKNISSHSSQNHEWYLDVLFFGKKWFELNKNSALNCCKIKYYFLEQAWKQSYNCRNNMAYDLAKEIFTRAVTEKRIKPKPVILNTLKHLLSISDGFYPAYAPALDDLAAPIDLIRDVYNEVYKVQADPTVMEPTHLCYPQRPVYYSLQLPSLLENAPSVYGKNIIIDLRELSVLMEILKNTLPKDKLQFSFYHPHTDTAYGIEMIEKLFNEDVNFKKQMGAQRLKPLAKNSPFLKGCVRIKLLEDRVLPLPIL